MGMTNMVFTDRYQDGWVSKRLVLPLKNIKEAASLTICGRRHEYPENLTLSFYVNGQLLHEEINPTEKFSITVLLPAMMKGVLEIVASDVFVPQEVGLNEDVRQLSFLLDEVKLTGVADLMEPYHHLFSFTPSKKVYFLDEETWDEVAYALPPDYKVPDEDMLRELKEPGKPRECSSASIKGIVYDKFSGAPAALSYVLLLNERKQLITATAVDEHGHYQFDELSDGNYIVVGRSYQYGEQQIRVALNGDGMVIHIPVLPL
jgi:hypothetical protein